MDPIQLARRLFTVFQNAYNDRGQGLWSITIRDNEEALGFTVEEARAAVTILMHKRLIKWMGHSLTLTDEGNEACLHPQLLERSLGPLQPPLKPVVLSPNINVHGGHVQIGNNNRQTITYRSVLQHALAATEQREDVPAPVAAALRRLQEYPDIEALMVEAAQRAAKED